MKLSEEVVHDLLPKPEAIQERLVKNAEVRKLLLKILKLSQKMYGVTQSSPPVREMTAEEVNGHHAEAEEGS